MKNILLLCGCLLAVTVSASFAQSAAPRQTKKEKSMTVYVGTYTGEKSKGIYALDLNPETGALSNKRLAAEIVNPSFLQISPDHRFLYAVSETWDKFGTVSAFAITPETGALTLLNQQPTKGTGPCHLTIDLKGKHLLVANYGGGSIAAFPIMANGHLGIATAFYQYYGTSVNKARQEAPHAHAVYFDADNSHALAMDLGTDKIYLYQFDPHTGSLTPNNPPEVSAEPGAGPRHFAFHPNGKLGYAVNELNSTVTAYHYEAGHGTLEPFQSITTLPEGFHGNSTTAEIAVHPSGKFLYASNRGDDSIAVFAIDVSTGKLTPAAHQSTQGKTPRHFAFDPTGIFLFAANQDSNNIVAFRVNALTGALTPTGETAEVASPVCIVFLPHK